MKRNAAAVTVILKYGSSDAAFDCIFFLKKKQ